MRVSLFATCLVDTLYPDVGRAVVRLLERLGVEVDFPLDQTCCGQMHVNTGYLRHALPMVRNFARTFARAEAVVAPSASCVALVRDTYPELAQEAGDADLVGAVADLVPRVYELTEFLVDRLGVTDVGARFPHRVAYHPTCHSLRALRLGERPERLLAAVRGLELVEVEEADSCCGFGGTFAIKNPDVSAAMLADKTRALLASGAEVVCAADSSCLMHIGGGLRRQGHPRPTLHLAEILAGEQAFESAAPGEAQP
jgi:L-lactate dehydrogenase complex protein LldE